MALAGDSSKARKMAKELLGSRFPYSRSQFALKEALRRSELELSWVELSWAYGSVTFSVVVPSFCHLLTATAWGGIGSLLRRLCGLCIEMILLSSTECATHGLQNTSQSRSVLMCPSVAGSTAASGRYQHPWGGRHGVPGTAICSQDYWKPFPSQNQVKCLSWLPPLVLFFPCSTSLPFSFMHAGKQLSLASVSWLWHLQTSRTGWEQCTWRGKGRKRSEDGMLAEKNFTAPGAQGNCPSCLFPSLMDSL